MEKQVSPAILLYKHWKMIFVSLIISGILGIGITFLIPKRYQAHAIIYPTSSNSLNNVVATPEFGYEIHADRLIQILESQQIKDSVVLKFDLLNYFEIDAKESSWRYKLDKEYAKAITFSRSRYLSVIVFAKTTDPQLSADIVNYILSLVNDVRAQIFKVNGQKAVDVFSRKMLTQQAKVDSLLNAIYMHTGSGNVTNPLAEKHITQIQHQNEQGNYAAGDKAVIAFTKNNAGAEAEILINDYYYENNKLYNLKNEYDKALEKLSTPLPDVYVISEAVVNDHKISPSFRTNMIIAMALGLIAVVIFIFFRFKLEELRQK